MLWITTKCITRYGLIMLSVVAAVGCDTDRMPTGNSDSTQPPSPGGPPLEQSFSLAVGNTQSLAKGTLSPPTRVLVTRTNFTGPVTLQVENLPAGVSAFFASGSPLTAAYADLLFYVSEEASSGTFSNVLVRGVASGLPDQTAPLPLTIAEPPFVLTLSSAALSVTSGASASTTVNVARINYWGSVTLWTDIGNFHGTLPRGVTATFAPNPTTGTSSVLTLSVSAAAVPGVYDLWIYSEATPAWYVEGPKLRLTIPAELPR